MLGLPVIVYPVTPLTDTVIASPCSQLPVTCTVLVFPVPDTVPAVTVLAAAVVFVIVISPDAIVAVIGSLKVSVSCDVVVTSAAPFAATVFRVLAVACL